MVFPTLAFQLAIRYPRFREELLRILRVNPDIGRESLCSQMEKIILGPLQATEISTLIIIDALDECEDEEPASAILSILSRYVDKMPYVKFFITGRPQSRIRSGFRLEQLRPITEVLKLHDIQRSLVDIDIKLFLRARLTDMAEKWSDIGLTEDWPLPSDIDILCEKAAGWFTYASAVVKFVASSTHQPSERLAILVSLPQSTAHEGGSGIDSLYAEILRDAYHDVDRNNTQEIYLRFRSVVGAVLSAFSPLSMKSLSDLLHGFGTPFKISATLRPLHSRLLIPEDIEDPICVFHKSFPDFLTDPNRCQDMQFFVDPSVHHTEILLSCLSLMKERLKKNICNLDDHAILSEVEDLSARQRDCIGEALEYACCFWTNHLIEVPSNGPHVEQVQKAISEFSTGHLLHWVEVLSLTRKLDTGISALNNIQQWYKLVSYMQSIS